MSQQPGFVLPTSQGSTQPLNRSREHSDASLYQPQPLRQPKLRPLYASEEQPGLEVVHAPTRGGGRAQSISEKAKSIWSGWSGYSRDPSEYTFYREPTPTPEESYEREKCDASIPAARRPGRSSTIALETAASIAPPPRRPKQDVICGIRRRLFTGILVALVLLIVGIVLGVGLGVGLGKHDQRETKDPGPVSRYVALNVSIRLNSPGADLYVAPVLRHRYRHPPQVPLSPPPSLPRPLHTLPPARLFRQQHRQQARQRTALLSTTQSTKSPVPA